MEQVFGSQTHYLLAVDGGEVAGILPLIHVKSALVGHYLTSLPGGMCARDDDAAQALFDKASQLVRGAGADYLILRDGQHKWPLPRLETNEAHVTFVIDLQPGLETVRKNMQAGTRRALRHALRDGLEVKDGTALLPHFYPVYARAMRDMGTPTPGFSFFRNLTTHFPDNLSLLTVFHDDQVLGGGLVASLRDTVLCTWAGVLRKYYNLRPNHLLYWETIVHSDDHGFRWLDLGRCRRDSGAFTFKKGWGGELRQLYQQTYLHGISKAPAVGKQLEERRQFRIFVKLWRMLPPQVAEILGPLMRKRMPFG
ncbi:MAG: GNAT family N-acetyltransferase [Anaerolineaceae bacterium]|nr:GNAT family N-acetyltransferase [Anaerolineaceae bacterium]